MTGPLASLCLATAAWLPGALALRRQLAQASSMDSPPAVQQKLGNLRDLQYWAEFDIGTRPQTIKGIFDTGSFEMVVFSKNCTSCGIAGAFSAAASSTFKPGTLEMEHAYGSGRCIARDGFDSIEVQGQKALGQPLWMANDCAMPLLEAASFNAIVGIGPPGEPVLTAKEQLDEIKIIKNKFGSTNQTVPEDVEDMEAQIERELKIAESKPSLLEKLGVTTFSTCLEKEPDSPGWLIWNDQTREGEPGVQKLHVVGKVFWSIQVDGMSLNTGKGGATYDVGCSGGCGGIVDTGTSLLAVHTGIYNAITQAILSIGLGDKCDDLSAFPDLEMRVGEHTLRLPPSAYMGTIYGKMSHKVSPYLRRDFLNKTESRMPCQLLVMDIGDPEMTSAGPMMIIGMPFFREYYTTFDLGSGPGNRSILVSESVGSCLPKVGGQVENERARVRTAYVPRRVDAASVRVPSWLRTKKLNF